MWRVRLSLKNHCMDELRAEFGHQDDSLFLEVPQSSKQSTVLLSIKSTNAGAVHTVACSACLYKNTSGILLLYLLYSHKHHLYHSSTHSPHISTLQGYSLIAYRRRVRIEKNEDCLSDTGGLRTEPSTVVGTKIRLDGSSSRDQLTYSLPFPHL